MLVQHSPGSDDGRDFSCSYCQRTFRRLEHLQRHTRRHTNEKPFACHCGALFSRRDLLRRHERIACHSKRSTIPERGVDDNERLTQVHSSPTVPQLGPSGDIHSLHSQPEQTSALSRMPLSSGSRTSIQANQSLGTGSNPSGSCSISPAPEPEPQEVEQREHHEDPGEYLQSEYNRRESFGHEFPTIFPSPQLSLATQIVPYFTTPSVTASDRSRLLASLGEVNKSFSNPRLPSNNALTRYLAGYFTGFYPHVPFTHPPTFKLESCSPELCLAMMAVGALDRFEKTSATELFYLAKALLIDSQQRRARSEPMRQIAPCTDDPLQEKQLSDEMRCLLCLAQFASWQSDPSLKNEACVLQSLLGQSLRSSGLEEGTQAPELLPWEQWSERESQRRTKLFAFCFLAIQSIAYDVPPIIWCDEVNLKLPCSCPEWTAPDATTWSMLRYNTPNEQGRFQDTLNILLSPTYQIGRTRLTLTPVANYILMHGLLQKIIWTRRSVVGNSQLSCTKDYQSTFESALRNWTLCWVQTPESNLEPTDPNGPLPFTSSALLSLAYIRNCFDVFRTRKIITWNHPEIADVLRTLTAVDRNMASLLAAYHATNLLATLVKLGVQYFKHNQGVLWSIEATLCGLDSSIFLEKWLRQVHATMRDTPLTDHEIRLLQWIENIVCEGLSSANDCSFDKEAQAADLPDQIILLWSHIMQGNSPYSFIRMIGEVLVEYRRPRPSNH